MGGWEGVPRQRGFEEAAREVTLSNEEASNGCISNMVEKA